MGPVSAGENYLFALESWRAGRLPEAIAAARRAVEICGTFFDARVLLADLLKETGNARKAAAEYHAAIAIALNPPQLLHDRGAMLANSGQPREGEKFLRMAIAARPDDASAHRALLFLTNYHPDYDAQAILREHLKWNQKFVAPLAASIRPHDNDKDPDRRLRIGYVSADFRDHVLAAYHIPLLAHHDHAHFEIFCYSCVRRPDAITQRMQSYADVWRDVAALSDEQLAQQIRNDRIDILVDLTMHVGESRQLLFAQKPAPVQAQWCYPGTTGNQQIDYRLTDPYLDPPASGGTEPGRAGMSEAGGLAPSEVKGPGLCDGDYSEKSIRLPETFFIYDPLTDQPTVNELPALHSGYITFGCLNSYTKVNDDCLRLWADVLQAVPDSRLLLMAPPGDPRRRAAALLQSRGVDFSRIQFVDRQPRLQYFQLYNRIDIGLDTVPYNGHTTSMDALWMGVPVVTLIGKTAAGRAGWSLCCNLTLRELAAHTPQQFVQIATKLAAGLPALASLRQSLRNRMQSSPLMDGQEFAKGVEAAYRRIWKKWCET